MVEAKKRIYSPYEYIGKVWYDWEDKEEEIKSVLFAYSLTEAARKLDAEYGDELNEIKIVPCEEGSVYEFGEDCGCIFDTSKVRLRTDKPNPTLPEKIHDILVEEGQKNLKFKLGETIKYDPLEVANIIKKHIDELN